MTLTPEQISALVERCDEIGDQDNGYGCAAAIRNMEDE